MIQKQTLKALFAVFSLMLIFSVGANAQKTDCSKRTEADIVKSIYDKMRDKYADQMNHINVRFKDNVVTVEGWTMTKKARKEIEKIAKKTDCVKRVVNNLTVGVSGGCGPGQKRCGDICIGSSENCNITKQN